jgi:hypothetical protein
VSRRASEPGIPEDGSYRIVGSLVGFLGERLGLPLWTTDEVEFSGSVESKQLIWMRTGHAELDLTSTNLDAAEGKSTEAS